jgi:DNA-directed RNA polymerase specialized sigma24 family protein
MDAAVQFRFSRGISAYHAGVERSRIFRTRLAHRVLESSDDLLLLDEALDRLSAEDKTAVEIVKLQLFAGISVEEAADALGLARATAYRHWTFARAWLRCELGAELSAE